MFSRLMIYTTMALASANAAASPSLPDRLHGQWTDDRSHCAGEDTGGMRVSAKQVAFYESVGTPKVVRTSSNSTISAEMAYSGEGKTWTETNRFVVSSDRSSVRVTALGRDFTLTRCAAAK